MSNNSITRAQEKTYQALLGAGLQLLLEKGFDNLTVTEITDRADYGRSTFYLYFKDKEDMAWQLLKYQADQMDQFLMKSTAHLASPQREWEAWRLMFETIHQQREFFTHMDGKLSTGLRLVQKQYLNDMFERNLQSGFFRIGIDLPHDIGARFLVGTVLEIMEYWLQNPEMGTPEEMATHMYRIVFHQSPNKSLREGKLET